MKNTETVHKRSLDLREIRGNRRNGRSKERIIMDDKRIAKKRN